MRWLAFAIAAVIAVALETSFLPRLFSLSNLGEIYPGLVGLLVVFVALHAARGPALWAAWAAGLLLDLALAQPAGLLIGPHALGFTFGAFIVLQARSIVFRKRLMTVAVLTVVCLLASAVIEVAIFTVRSWAGADVLSAGFRPFIELLRRGGMAIYSGLLAIPAGWLLMRSAGAWGFAQSSERRSWR